MDTITRKKDIESYLNECLAIYHSKDVTACVKVFSQQILSKKVKFPLLEYCGNRLYQEIAEQQHLDFCDQIEALKTVGGNVILGIVLQCRLGGHFQQSLQKATEYITQADAWYVCDIIGERVFGYALLHSPDKTIPELERLSQHSSRWVIRSLGAGTHYAIKKGLSKQDVEAMFELLLTMANSNDKEIRQGIGWAAKTTAKFHPDIIEAYQAKIQDKSVVANWFRSKINIGLSRHTYAQGN